MRTRLSRLRPGSRAIVLRTEGDSALSRRLMLVSLRGFRVALRRAEGERIFVETGDKYENHSTGG